MRRSLLTGLVLLLGSGWVNAQAPIQCFNSARLTDLSGSEALQLCSGLDSLGPINCYQQARAATPLSKDQSLRLCQCSISTEPVDCFNQAILSSTLSQDEAVNLCQISGKDTWQSDRCRYFSAPLGVPSG